MNKKNMNSEWEIMFGKQKPKGKNKESIKLKELITEDEDESLLKPIEEEKWEIIKENEINSDKVIMELKKHQFDMLNDIAKAKESKKEIKQKNQFCQIS